jgi:hypothetical protein
MRMHILAAFLEMPVRVGVDESPSRSIETSTVDQSLVIAFVPRENSNCGCKNAESLWQRVYFKAFEK